MAALGLGDLARFPFVEPPDQRQVTAGRQLLEELGALDTGNRLTRIGRQLSTLPVDPRMGRMILEAERRGVLREVLVITAALSLPDPRERPLEHQAQADQLHARFRHEHSDFLSLLEPVGAREDPAARPQLERLPAAVQDGVPQLPADPGVAGARVPAAAGRQAGRRGRTRGRGGRPTRRPRPRPAATGERATRTASTRPCSPGCCPTSASRTARPRRTRPRPPRPPRTRRPGPGPAAAPATSAPATPASASSRARRWPSGSPRS